ncbi:MAG: LysR family transcriptional regulator, partial [Mesorhizobium sp.]
HLDRVAPLAARQRAGRDAVEVVDCPGFKPQVRCWLLHRPPAGRLARPIAVFREALAEALKGPMPLIS